jgi:hypothetical protein
VTVKGHGELLVVESTAFIGIVKAEEGVEILEG